MEALDLDDLQDEDEAADAVAAVLAMLTATARSQVTSIGPGAAGCSPGPGLTHHTSRGDESMPIVDQDAPKVTPDPAANPRDSWPDWTDEDRWEADGYTPTFDEEAEEAGYQAGLEGAGPCSSPTSWPSALAAGLAFATGRQRGVRERERAARDEAEHEAWLDQAYDALPPRETDGYAPGYYS